MALHRSNHFADARSCVALDARAKEAKHGPAVRFCGSVETCVVRDSLGARMPVVAVGLNDHALRSEDEVGLPAAKHRAVHLECEASGDECVMKRLLDAGHLRRKSLAHARAANLGAPGFIARTELPCLIELRAARGGVNRGACLQPCHQLGPRLDIAPVVEASTPARAEDLFSLLTSTQRHGHNDIASVARHNDATTTEAKRGPTSERAEASGAARARMHEGRGTLLALREAAGIAVARRPARGVERRSALRAVAAHLYVINQRRGACKEAHHGA